MYMQTQQWHFGSELVWICVNAITAHLHAAQLSAREGRPAAQVDRHVQTAGYRQVRPCTPSASMLHVE